MAADSDGSGDSLTTIVTCEGDFDDPTFRTRFESVLDKLHPLLCETAARDRLRVKKVEPWNSVRVTLTIPREAAVRLRQLASEGSQQLRALGILSVQLEGDQVISLRIAGQFGQEPQEIVLTTGSQDGPSTSAQTSEASSATGITKLLSTTTNQSFEPPGSEKVQFRSPNVVCPPDTQVPKVPQSPIPQTIGAATATGQRSYNVPFPFASMTHAAHAIHNRQENQSSTSAHPAQLGSTPQASSPQISTQQQHMPVANDATLPFTQPPPPYPSQPSSITKSHITPCSPNVAMSSPLLVNLLQNDTAQSQSKAPRDQNLIAKPGPSFEDTKVKQENTFAQPQNVAVPQAIANGTPNLSSAVKYPGSVYPTSNLTVTGSSIPNATQTQTVSNQVGRATGSRFPQQLVQRPPLRPPQPSINLQSTQIKSVRPAAPVAVSNQKFPTPTVPNQYNSQFVRPNFRPQFNQQQFGNPPPYPRQRLDTPASRSFQENLRYQPRPQTWTPNQFQVDSLPVTAQPMPSLASLSQNLQSPQPVLQLGNSTIPLPSMTSPLEDLSKTDLDSLLPSIEPEVDTTPLDIPESITSTGKKRQYLINPETGILESMPSESSSSESEAEDVSDAIFNFNSPNERSNSVFSDDDTCSTTTSRKFDNTDQSDSETVRSTNSDNSVKSHQRLKLGKNRDRNRDSQGKDLPTQEKIKLRLKLEKPEKNEPVSQAYKVDVSFVNTSVKRVTPTPSSALKQLPPGAPEEPRVPPLHISLRGRNSVVISGKKEKKHKFNPDVIDEVKKSSKVRKTSDGVKVKKSVSAKDLPIRNTDLLPVLSKSEPNMKGAGLNDAVVPSTSQETLSADPSETKSKSDDDVPLNYKLHDDVSAVKSLKNLQTDVKKSKKLNKLNHLDFYREQNLLTGGHIIDEQKFKKQREEKVANMLHKVPNCGKLNSGFNMKREKLKERLMREGTPTDFDDGGSDSESFKGIKRHGDSNGLLQSEKKRRMSQSEIKAASNVTESQGAIKSVKLKPLLAHSPNPTSEPPPVVGSTNIGTIAFIPTKTSKSMKLLELMTKDSRREKTSLAKAKEGSTKSKDFDRDKTYSKIVAEKLSKQLTLPTGEIDMEAKFKQRLMGDLKSYDSVLHRSDEKEKPRAIDNRVNELVQILSEEPTPESNQRLVEYSEKEKPPELDAGMRQNCKIPEKEDPLASQSPDRKSVVEKEQVQRIEDKQVGRSPNSGGQGEDSGIESMDALSEKSPNQASQSPHSHAEITLTDTTAVLSEMKTVKSEIKEEPCLSGLMDIEAQLAKMEGLQSSPLNGDLNHIKVEYEIEEKVECKDLNENKELPALDTCCEQKPHVSELNLDDLPLNSAIQESLKQGDVTITQKSTCAESPTSTVSEVEITLIGIKSEEKPHAAELKASVEMRPDKAEHKDLDFDPLPVRITPPLYTYSNPEKQSRESDSPIPCNLSDLEYSNSDTNSETSESRIKQKNEHERRRKQKFDENLDIKFPEMECLEDKFLDRLSNNFNVRNETIKKSAPSILEQLLIEIPSEMPDKTSYSPSVSEKSITAKSSVRTRSSSKLNSPDTADKKTPKHSPLSLNSPALSAKTSPKILKPGIPVKRKRQESESSTQSNVSVDELGTANVRNKKARKSSENALGLIKACMGVDNAEVKVKVISRDLKKVDKCKQNIGLLRRVRPSEVDSSDSDEPLIEVAGKVRNKNITTRNKINSTKSNIPTPVKSVPVVNKTTDEKVVGTRRSVRNNSYIAAVLKTRSKLSEKVGDKPSGEGDAQVRRKTRSTVTDVADNRRRRSSRDSK